MSLEDVLNQQKKRGEGLNKFISLKDRESFTGAFVDVVNAPSNKFFEPDKTPTINAVFTFKIDGADKEFKLRAASKGTRNLINSMQRLGVKSGDALTITRVGSGVDTDYKVEVAKVKTTVTSTEDKDDITESEVNKIFEK